MDPIIVVTPLLVAAIVLLLGFAGCDRVFKIDPVEPPPPPFLTLRARVPMALVVREIFFTWDPPNIDGGSKTLTKPDPTSRDGDDNLFDHVLTGELDPGSWTVTCRLTVGGGDQQGVEASGTFTLPLEGSTNPIATFQATVTDGPLTLGNAFIGAA